MSERTQPKPPPPADDHDRLPPGDINDIEIQDDKGNAIDPATLPEPPLMGEGTAA